MKEKRIVHIQIKDTGKDYYGTSLAVLIDHIGAINIGAKYQHIRNYMSKNNTDIYDTGKSVIKKGVLLVKEKTKRKEF